MSPLSVLLVLVSLAGLAFAISGIVLPRRSPPALLGAVIILPLAVLGAWHAWGESQSLPWTVAYGSVAIACLWSGIRQIAIVK